MNKTTLFAGVIIGMSVLAGPAHADSWFKPNPYSYDKLAGSWHTDVTLKKEDGTMRFCGTERFLANGTSRVQGQAIIYVQETTENLGVVVDVALDSSNKVEVIGDKLVRTTMSVSNQLSELYFVHNGEVVQTTDVVRNYAISEMKNVVASLDSVNQVEQGTINKLTATTMTETDAEGTTVESVRTDKLITECN